MISYKLLAYYHECIIFCGNVSCSVPVSLFAAKPLALHHAPMQLHYLKTSGALSITSFAQVLAPFSFIQFCYASLNWQFQRWSVLSLPVSAGKLTSGGGGIVIMVDDGGAVCHWYFVLDGLGDVRIVWGELWRGWIKLGADCDYCLQRLIISFFSESWNQNNGWLEALSLPLSPYRGDTSKNLYWRRDEEQL
jgi:hypothetical protein